MEFNVNSPILFVIVGIIIAAVVGQSVFFLVRAIKRAKAKNMDMKIIKKTISSAAVFTIAPAIAVLVGVVALSKSLGVAIPWLRLSVIGSLTYETTAAAAALGPLGLSTGTVIPDASSFVTVLFVMTFGIAIGILLVPLITKKVSTGMLKLESKDKKWGDILGTSMFMGMISAFLGYVFCDMTSVFKGETYGLIPVLVMIVSAVVMAIVGTISKKAKVRWLEDYALPLSLICGMASAIPLTSWLG